jgi:hypothetical protein
VALAQWVSRDLIGFEGGDWNQYGYVGNDPINFIDVEGEKPTKGHQSTQHHNRPKLKDCPPGFDAKRGSVTQCNAPHMGMKKMYCQHKVPNCPATCCCDELSQLTNGMFVAIKGSKLVCGATLQLMNRITGEKVTVTVIDEGPYANDAGIDINVDVFHSPPTGSTWPVCVGPISQNSPPKGWEECQKGSKCG